MALDLRPLRWHVLKSREGRTALIFSLCSHYHRVGTRRVLPHRRVPRQGQPLPPSFARTPLAEQKEQPWQRLCSWSLRTPLTVFRRPSSSPPSRSRWCSLACALLGDLARERTDDEGSSDRDRGDATPDKLGMANALRHLSDFKLWAFGLLFSTSFLPLLRRWEPNPLLAQCPRPCPPTPLAVRSLFLASRSSTDPDFARRLSPRHPCWRRLQHSALAHSLGAAVRFRGHVHFRRRLGFRQVQAARSVHRPQRDCLHDWSLYHVCSPPSHPAKAS